MNNLRLQIIDKSSTNCYHVKVFVNEQESGILYLSEEQFFFFQKALQKESNEKDINFEVEDPFSDEDAEFDLD